MSSMTLHLKITVTMASTDEKINLHSKTFSDKSSVVVLEDDFMYDWNVAQSHIYIRLGFLRKVYGILSAQLLCTTIVSAVFLFTPSIKTFVQENNWLLMVAFILCIGLLIGMFVKRMETPINYYLLAAFSLVESYTVATIVTFYDQKIVLEAFLLTFAVVAALTFYTLQSKRDLTGLCSGLFTVLLILILTGFMQVFLQSDALELILAVGGAILFSLFIVYDTHLLMRKLSAEEYVVAVISLYLDIINLFLHILRCLHTANKLILFKSRR